MPRLIVLLGPTAVGKTALSVELAKVLNAPIISADSRQIYKEIPIGTATPSLEELGSVPHHFIAERSIHEPFSASLFEEEALDRLEQVFKQNDTAIMTGGSMMYLDAICRGIDEMPDVKEAIREQVYQRYESEGLQGILEELKELDPVYYERVDKCNYKRVLHGYEVCLSTGRAFSSFHTGEAKVRPFDIIKIGLNRERSVLYERINERVKLMFEQGLEEEARNVYTFRHLNALNTVGFKELFAYFDGSVSRDEALRQIQKNSRVYARKQLTWWRKDEDIKWFEPTDFKKILDYIQSLGVSPKSEA